MGGSKYIIAVLIVLLTLIIAPTAKAATPHWRLAYSTTFEQPAKLGKFSGCTQNEVCASLPANVKWQWWAYPFDWPDTATQRNYPVGGYYNPSQTVWISGGQMHIRMYRVNGAVNSAALVPREARNRLYGQYVETFRVSQISQGYKSAHLLWPSNGNQNTTTYEVDFPENEWDTTISGFIHKGNNQLSYDTAAKWSSWHTSIIRWWPGHLQLLLDGKVIANTTKNVPTVPMDWIIQNESALNGESAPKNSSAQMDISYVAYYAYQG